jgi:hypothetical protein
VATLLFRRHRGGSWLLVSRENVGLRVRSRIFSSAAVSSQPASQPAGWPPPPLLDPHSQQATGAVPEPES